PRYCCRRNRPTRDKPLRSRAQRSSKSFSTSLLLPPPRRGAPFVRANLRLCFPAFVASKAHGEIHISLESPANRETKSRFGLEIIKPARVIDNSVQLRLDLQPKNRRVNGAESVFQESDFLWIDERCRGNDLFIQAVHVVGVVDAERRLHDGQL